MSATLTPEPDLRAIELPDAPVPAGDGWRIHIYAHTHWDREWYRTHERFRMQLVGMIDRVLQTLDLDSNFTTFVLDGQTIVLEDYLEMRPEEEPRLHRLAAAGRLEVGPWQVLPDEFLVSSESLIRNLLEGRRVASRLGKPLAVGYLPDPFGHIAQLPAILRGFGIDNVIFSRGMGDAFERTGSEFRWEAQDGTDVLAIVQTSPYTNGYCNFELAGRGNTPLDDEPYEAARTLGAHLAESAKTNVLVFAAGCDHETIQADLPDITKKLGKVFPGAEIRLSGLDEVVASVRNAEKNIKAAGGALERYRGELRGSLHAPILASIFSARVPLKQENDDVQMLLERHVEPLMATAVLAGVRPARDVDIFLRRAWRLVLKNHPHDSIGGCSVDKVHLEMHPRSMRAKSIGMGLIEDLRIALDMGDIPVVHDAEACGGIAQREDGSTVSLKPSKTGSLVPLVNLISDDELKVTNNSISVDDLSVSVEEGRWFFRSGKECVELEWIDEADAGDEYDFGEIPESEILKASVKEYSARSVPGTGVAELEVVHTINIPESVTDDRMQRSDVLVKHEIKTTVRVSKSSKLANLVVELNNQSKDHRLRLRAVPMRDADRLSKAEALGHFAIIERPVRPIASGATWKQVPPGLDHCCGAVRLIATSVDDPVGSAAVLLAGRGIHEYESREVNTNGQFGLELTVLRSVGWLSRDDIKGRPGHAGPALQTPNAQCIGKHKVELAVGVGASRVGFDGALQFLNPPLVIEAFGPEAKGESGALARSRDVRSLTPPNVLEKLDNLGLKVGGKNVNLSAFKLADDRSGDLIVRWWTPVNVDKDSARATLELAYPVESVQRVRLDETPLGPAPFKDGRGEWRVKPGGIFTVRVKLAAALQ